MRTPDHSAAADTESETGVVESGAIFDALSRRRRRYCCYCLSAVADGETTVDAPAAEVVRTETGVDGSDPSDDDYDRVRSSLHHRHLPKLADAGIVVYEPADRTVTYRRRPLVHESIERAHH